MRNSNIILTKDEIAIVNNLIWEKPVREVAAKIGRSLVALHYYLKHRDNYPPPVNGAPNSKVKPMSPPISTKGTASKRLKSEPEMTHYQQKERIDFANLHIHWTEDHWRKVVFHDERKFNLDGPDGFTHYYHDLRNYERTLSQRPRGGSVFIWFALCYCGPIHCEVSTTKFGPEAFVEFIQKDNLAAKQAGVGLILQDTSNIFRNSSIENCGDINGIKTQTWPSLSHDINIVENVWGWLIREVYDSGRRYSRRDDLVAAVQMAWNRLPLNFIQNLYTTLPERIMELKCTNGIYTNC